MSSPARPAHAQIAALLRDRIESGDLPVGAPLPSERELAATYDVSRMTARQALMVLESEGHVRRQSPVGTTVSRRLTIRIGSFSDEISRGGAAPGDRLLSAEPQNATAAIAAQLGINAGDDVFAIRRLRTGDGEPIAIEHTYFPAALTPDLLDEGLEDSLWKLLRRRYRLVPARAEATLEVITLDDATAALLDARVASSALLLTRTTYDSRGRAIEYARDTYRADRVRFNVSALLGSDDRPAKS